MSRKDKLVKRLLEKPKDFTWEELTSLLKGLGYKEFKRGKTGRSRRCFMHDEAPSISLHKPHPGNVVKMYVIRDLIELLKRENLI